MNAVTAILAEKSRHWLAVLALGIAFAGTAAADVTLTATSPAGSSLIQRGGTFDVDLTWSGTPAIAATDYAVTLNTSQIVLGSRDLTATLTPYVDTPYLATLPAATNRVDVTWFKAAGFTGKDVTLHFQVPADYSGPSTVAIGLVVSGVQDASAADLVASVVTTTVQIANTAPTISDVADQIVNEDSPTAAIPFTIGDAETAAASLTVSGSSSNTSLVPNANIVFGGSGASRTVTVTPALNQSGTATITLSVSDGSNTTTDTFILTVNAANDAPTISDVANQSTNTSTPTAAIPFTVGDVETAATDLVVTATSSNTSLVPNSNISLGGSGASRNVTLTPVTGVNGTTTITLNVSDGALSASDTFDLTVSTPLVLTTYTWAQPGSATVYAWGTPANWTPNSAYPNATNHAAKLNTTASDIIVNLNATITLGDIDSTTGKLVINAGTPAGSFIFDNGNPGIQTITWTAAQRYGFEIYPNMLLNDSLSIEFASSSIRACGVFGVVSGDGALSVKDSTYSTTYPFQLGATGGAANTHTLGTNLSGLAGGSVEIFSVNKANVFGSGALGIDAALVRLNGYSQTFAGLNGGGNSASLIAQSGSPALTLNGSGSYAFSGVISGAISLAKSGSGTQILTGANAYTGATGITGGSLLVNGSLAAGSAVTVGPNGTLGGIGTVSGTIDNQGTVAPGTSVGTLTTGALTMAADSQACIEFTDWAGTTPGTGWDWLNCASLALAGTQAHPIVIKLVPLNLTNFAETAKTFTIATSAAAITGFDASAISINSSAMPGTGTWSAQLDATQMQLQLVYTAGGTPVSSYGGWAQAKGLTDANNAANLDPDNDGRNNLAEFAFNGDPLKASDNGMLFTESKDTGADPDSNKELACTVAVRRGAVFTAPAGQAQVSAAIDGVIYTVEGGADPAGPWNTAVSNAGASNTPPAGSGLPDLTGTQWEYRTFSAFNGLPGKGFIRIKVVAVP